MKFRNVPWAVIKIIEFSAVMEMFSLSVLSSTVATSHMWLLSTWNGISASEELNFKMYLILINLNLGIWLVAYHTEQHRFDVI